MNSLAIVAIEAQKLHGYAQPLSGVSNAGEYKIEQSSADGLVYITENGGAWTPLVGGGGVSLDDAYNVGNTITVTDAIGAVGMNGTRVSGSVLSITNTATLTGQLTGISIDLSGSGAAGSAQTIAVPALTIVGAHSAVSKVNGLGVVSIISAYRNASALRVRVRNKGAVAGSLISVGWDTTNYEGIAAASTLDATTHMLTLNGQDNVTAGSQEFVGARILIPDSSSGATCAVRVESNQTAGALFSAEMGAITLSGTISGFVADFSAVVPGAQIVVGSSVTIPASTNTATYGYSVSSLQRAGVMFYGRIAGATTLNGQMLGLYLELDDATGLVPNGIQLVGASIKTATGSNTGDRGINVECGARSASAACASFTLSPASSSNANVITATSNANVTSSAGVDGNLFYGVMNAAGGRGVRVQTGSFTAASAGGLGIFYRTGTWSGGGTESIAMMQFVRDMTTTNSPTLSAPVAQVSSAPTNSSGTLTYSANEVTIARAPVLGGGTINMSGSLLSLSHTTVATGADTTSLITGTTNSKSGTLVSFTTTGTLTGTTTLLDLSASGATASTFAVVGARVRVPASSSASTRAVMVNTSQTAGVAVDVTPDGTLSGTHVILSLNGVSIIPGAQAVTGVSIVIPASTSADTRAIKVASTQTGAASVGVEIGMTPGSSADVIGQLITMGANSSSSARAIDVVWDSLAGSISGIVRINASVNGTTTSEQTMLYLGSDTATYTLGAKLDGIECNLSSNISAGVNRLMGHRISIGASSSADTRAIYSTSTQTGAGSAGVETVMSPGSSASVIGHLITMGANATGAAISIGHSGTNANQLVFTSAADGAGAHIYGPTTGQLNIFAGLRADAGTGRSVAVYAGAGVSSTNGGGDVLLAGGAPVSTGSYGYVKAQTALAETSAAVTYTASGTTTIDVSLGNSFTATVATGVTTWAFSNPPGSGLYYSFTLTLTNGGLFAQTWPGSVKWPGGGAPVLTAAGVDVLVFFTIDGGTTWRGVVAQADSK